MYYKYMVCEITWLNAVQWRIWGGGEGPRQKFLHFHAVFEKNWPNNSAHPLWEILYPPLQLMCELIIIVDYLIYYLISGCGSKFCSHERARTFTPTDYSVHFSAAIMIYLCDKYADIPYHWYPKEPKRRAKIHQFLGWYPSTLRKLGSDVFLEKVCILNLIKHHTLNLHNT